MKRIGQFVRRSPLSVILPSLGLAIFGGYAYFKEDQVGKIQDRVTVIEREVVPCLQDPGCARYARKVAERLQQQRREEARREQAPVKPVSSPSSTTEGSSTAPSTPAPQASQPSRPPSGRQAQPRPKPKPQPRPRAPRKKPPPPPAKTVLPPPATSPPPPENKPPAQPADKAKATVEANLPELPVVGKRSVEVCIGNCK